MNSCNIHGKLEIGCGDEADFYAFNLYRVHTLLALFVFVCISPPPSLTEPTVVCMKKN